MPDPIKIVVTAETAQAAAAIRDFATGAGAAVKSIGGAADETGAHIAGMSYYFRSAIDQIRFAAMGGGPRAAFYAIDELVRGLVASGMSLTTLVPVIGGLGVAIGAGVLAWKDFGDHMDEDAQKAKNLADALRKIPDVLKSVFEAEKLGAIDHETAQKYASYLSGKTPLYVGPGGTDKALNLVETPTIGGNRAGGGAVGPQTFAEYLANVGPAGTMQAPTFLPHATHQQINDFLLQQNNKALAENADKVAANEEQQAEDALANKADKLQKTQESEAEVKRKFAEDWQQANKAIEDQITAQVQASGKQRESFYEQEYKMRVDAATRALFQGEISETEYTDAVAKATAQMLDDQRKVNEELQREAQLRQEIARAGVEAKLKGIAGAPFLTEQEKNNQSAPLYDQLIQANNARIAQLTAMAQTTKDDSARLEAQKQITELTGQQVELYQKLNAATNQSSWIYQLGLAATKLRDIPPLAQQIGSVLENTVNTAINSIALNITKVIDGTEKWHKALLNIAESVINQLIEGLLKVIEKLIVEEILTLTIKAISGGVFAEGGYTGDGAPDEVAGVVHKGEFVMPASRVKQIGLDKLEVMRQGGPFVADHTAVPMIDSQTAMAVQGRGMAGGYSPVVQGHSVNLHFYDDRPHPRDYLSSGEGEQQVINIARKNRLKIGVGT